MVLSLASSRLVKTTELIEKLTIPAHLNDSRIFIERLLMSERCTPSLASQVVLLSKCVKKSCCIPSYRTSLNFQRRLNYLLTIYRLNRAVVRGLTQPGRLRSGEKVAHESQRQGVELALTAVMLRGW